MFYEISILLNLVLIFHVINKVGAESKNSIQILFLKSQLSAYKRKRKKFHTKPFERLKLVFLSCLDPNWIENLILVSPHTLLEWRNNKFKTFWALLSRKKKQGDQTFLGKSSNSFGELLRKTKSGELQNCTAFF